MPYITFTERGSLNHKKNKQVSGRYSLNFKNTANRPNHHDLRHWTRSMRGESVYFSKIAVYYFNNLLRNAHVWHRNNLTDEKTVVEPHPAVNFLRLQKDLDECIEKVGFTKDQYVALLRLYWRGRAEKIQELENRLQVLSNMLRIMNFLREHTKIIQALTVALGCVVGLVLFFIMCPHVVILGMIATLGFGVLPAVAILSVSQRVFFLILDIRLGSFIDLSDSIQAIQPPSSPPAWDHDLDLEKINSIFKFFKINKPVSNYDIFEVYDQIKGYKPLLKKMLDEMLSKKNGLEWECAKTLAKNITPGKFAELPLDIQELVKVAEQFVDRQSELLPFPDFSFEKTLSSTAAMITQLPPTDDKKSISSLEVLVASSETGKKPSANEKAILAAMARQQEQRSSQAQNMSQMVLGQQPDVSTDSVGVLLLK